MSTLQTETIGNITHISGELTFDYNEMLNELGDKNHMCFGDLSKQLVEHKFGDPLDKTKINDLQNKGKNWSYYESKNIFCYLCIRPSDYANYMFSPMDSENRDNEFSRLRGGVKFFHEKGFDVYIVA